MAQENNICTEVLGNENGTVIFAPEVVATIAGVAAGAVEGVSALNGNVVEGFTELFGKKNLSKGVKVEMGEGCVAVSISVIIEFGKKMHLVCSQAQKDVKEAVAPMTGVEVTEVNIYVQGVQIPKTEENAPDTTAE